MIKSSEINKTAWEYRAYEFLVQRLGTPSEHGKLIKKDPKQKLKNHIKYFNNIENLEIANICGSNGRRAIALGLLGANPTVFDISKENMRYALELAGCCGVNLNYELGDIYDIDKSQYADHFDILYLEGGILHYFHDIDRFMEMLFTILKPNGHIVLNDFHPFRKVMPINFFKDTVSDYFDNNIHVGDVASKDFLNKADGEVIPDCSYRYYTISEILNAVIRSGFRVKEFNEEPSWTDTKLPGEITIYAIKE